MKVDIVVKKETGKIALGVAVLCAIMLSVFAFLHMLDHKVILGTLLGAAAAVFNFFLMALSVQKSAEKMNGTVIEEPLNTDDEETDEEEKTKPLSPQAQSAKKIMQVSYTFRMLILVAVAIIAVTIPVFNPIPCLIALLFPRIVICAVQLIRNKKGGKNL